MKSRWAFQRKVNAKVVFSSTSFETDIARDMEANAVPKFEQICAQLRIAPALVEHLIHATAQEGKWLCGQIGNQTLTDAWELMRDELGLTIFKLAGRK